MRLDYLAGITEMVESDYTVWTLWKATQLIYANINSAFDPVLKLYLHASQAAAA